MTDEPKGKSSTTLYHVFIVEPPTGEVGETSDTLRLRSVKRDVPAYNPKRACEIVVESGEPQATYVALPMSSIRAHAVRSTTTIHTKAEEVAL